MKQILVVAVFAAATAFGAYAQTADKSGVAPNAPTKRMDTLVPPMRSPDPSGKSDLGVDITGAGNTPAENQKFVQALPSDQQNQVKQVCVVAVGEPANHATEVIHFCNNIM
jgi:hypothetical protein